MLTTDERLAALRQATCPHCHAGVPFDEEFSRHRDELGGHLLCEARLIEETFALNEQTPAQAAAWLAGQYSRQIRQTDGECLRPQDLPRLLREWFPQLTSTEAHERIMAARDGTPRFA